MEAVFTYGSLMFAPVWQRVVSGAYPSVPARAIDIARFAVRDAPYPGCLISPGAATDGRLYLNVSPRDCTALDVFEGAHYRRDRIVVQLPSGAAMAAWCYIYLPTAQLTDAAWNPARFEREHMHHFLATYTPTRNTP